MHPLSSGLASKEAAEFSLPLPPPRPRQRISTWIKALALFVCTVFLYTHLSAYVPLHSSVRLTSLSSFDLHKALLSVPSPERVSEWSAYYTNTSHLAGEGWEQAKWTRAKWAEFGIPDVTIASYDADLPAPSLTTWAFLSYYGERVSPRSTMASYVARSYKYFTGQWFVSLDCSFDIVTLSFSRRVVQHFAAQSFLLLPALSLLNFARGAPAFTLALASAPLFL